LAYDSLVYILSSVNLYSPNFLSLGWSVTKYNLGPDSLKTFNEYPTSYSNVPFGILFTPLLSTIKCFDGLAYNPTHVTNLDSNLNLTSIDTLPPLVTIACATSYDDSLYLLTGVVNFQMNLKQHLQIYKVNNNDDTLKSLEYYDNPDKYYMEELLKILQLLVTKYL
jgi:hypothetical protein